MDERDQQIEELLRANRRLSGALEIVLDTLDSENVRTLFDRVLEKLTTTMDADGTLIYMAEPDGFHLRGASASLEGAKISQFMPFGRAIESLATREGHGLRLSVQAPRADSLRGGRLEKREVRVEETSETRELEADLLPPFACFIATPVWFGGHVISIIEIGWRSPKSMREDDVRLLDSVANYLSVQLMGAFAAMRSQRAERLRAAATELRKRMFEVGEGEGNGVIEHFDKLCSSAAQTLEARAVVVRFDDDKAAFVADFSDTCAQEIPLNPDDLADNPQDAASMRALSVFKGLSEWLDERGYPNEGVLLDLGELLGARRYCLVLRAKGSEPIDSDEEAFLKRFAQDVRDTALGEERREEQVRISQALQLGMRSELQEVPGITAEGVYTSATASALVGGDFYDLVRLPDRRACVIMGDVSGKGVEAASVSAAVRTALAAYAWEGLSPARMVRSLNDYLLGFSRLETFATLFVGIVDLAKSKLTYCSAGHPPALLIRSSSAQAEMCDVQSGVVGAFPDIVYRDGTVKISANDILLLYTDGSTEARNEAGYFFGEEGVRDAALRLSKAGFEGFLERLLAALDSFTGNRLEDDVALVALRFDEVGA